MANVRGGIRIAAWAACCSASVLLADAEGDYQTLFGADEKRVAASTDTKDDGAFAAKLAHAAASVQDSPQLQRILYEKAYHFGRKDAAGSAACVAAVEALIASDPERANFWRGERLDAYRRRYAATRGAERDRVARMLLDLTVDQAEKARREGESARAEKLYRQALGLVESANSPLGKYLQAALRAAVADGVAEKKLRELASRLEASPADAKIRRELVLGYVIQRDRPRQAVPLLNDDLDEALRTYVPLAAREPGEVPPPVCLELAAWYRSLAEPQSARPKAVGLRRAMAYYRRYLGAPDQQDVERLKARLGLLEVREALRRLPDNVRMLLPPMPVVFTREAVQEAFDRGVQYLWASQNKPGDWAARANRRHPIGATAVVALALLESGAATDEPQMAKALAWLKAQTPVQTHDVAWRCCAYRAAARTRKTFLRPLTEDAAKLLASTADGSFWHQSAGKVHRPRGDAINSSYGLLAILAAARSGVAPPRRFWVAAAKYWTGAQRPDGAWAAWSGAKRPEPTLTAAGVVATLACYQQLHGDKVPKPKALEKCRPARRGVQWLDKNLGDALQPGRRYHNYYLYYLLARAARAGGRQKLAGANWPDTIADLLLANQAKTGAWAGSDGPRESTAWAILALIETARARTD